MKKIYPKLFGRSSHGKVLEWRIIQEDNKFASIHGTQDGLKVTDEWTVCEVKNLGKKNETSAEQQATLEIEAKYTKQLKSGYFENIKDIDKVTFFQPMLAKNLSNYIDKIDWKEGVGIQIKFNGGRIIAKKEGTFTRTGEKYLSIPHIEEALKPFFIKYPDAILDGEGFNFARREKLNEIMSLLRKTVHIEPEDLEQSKELIKYYIYDINSKDGYIERKKFIDEQFPENKYKELGYVQTWIIHSKEELNELYKGFIEERHEGAIIRILNKSYENKRSKYLLKYKPTDDKEFRITNVQEGDGNWTGKAKIISLETIDGTIFKDGTKIFDATFKGNMEQAKECLDNKDKLIGKIVTVYFNGYTGYLKPNYAQFDWNNYLKS